MSYEQDSVVEPLLNGTGRLESVSDGKTATALSYDIDWAKGGEIFTYTAVHSKRPGKKVKPIIIFAAFLCFIAGVAIASTKFTRHSKSLQQEKTSIQKSVTSPTSPDWRSPQVHYMMPSTKSNWMFCTSLASALVHDARPIILDWNANQTSYQIFMAKIELMTTYLNTYPDPNDIVILVDAFDNTLQRPIAEVVANFRSQHRTRILFGAEKNCCCMGESAEYRFCSDVPDSPLPKDAYGDDTDLIVSDREKGDWEHVRPRWLNSGTVIGYADDLRRFYNQVQDFHKNHPIGKTIRDDQSIFQHLFYKNQDKVRLDYLGDLIKPMWASTEEVMFAPRIESLEESTFSIGEENSQISHALLQGATPKYLFNVVTKKWSAFLHWNGPAKEMQKATYNRFWWSGAGGTVVQARVNEFLRGQKVHLDHKHGRALTWSQLCDTHLALEPSGFRIL